MEVGDMRLVLII